MIPRRQFITLLGGAAAWPLAADAQQQAGKLPTIGVLGSDATVWAPWTAAFERRLRQLGWVEGQTIAIEYRWAEGRPERDAAFAAGNISRGGFYDYPVKAHFAADKGTGNRTDGKRACTVEFAKQ